MARDPQSVEYRAFFEAGASDGQTKNVSTPPPYFGSCT
jgi:hypothetical protein